MPSYAEEENEFDIKLPKVIEVNEVDSESEIQAPIRRPSQKLTKAFSVIDQQHHLLAPKAEDPQAQNSPRGDVKVFDKDYVAPNALQYFQMETKSRKVINELMKPVNRDMEAEKLLLADFSVKLQGFMSRL